MKIEVFEPLKKNKCIKKGKRQPKAVQFIVSPILEFKTEKKFYLRGDLVIDIDSIRDLKWRQKGCSQFGFINPISVEFQQETQFFEIDLPKLCPPLQDFSFLIEMLDSLGENECHRLAIQLQDYSNFFKQFDEVKNSQQKEILFGQTPFHSYSLTSIQQNEFLFYWNFEDSCKKAKQIIKDKLPPDNENQFSIYQIVKADGSIEKFLISEKSSNILFGKRSVEEYSKLYLTDRQFFMSEDIFEVITKKRIVFEHYFNALLSHDNSNLFISQDIGTFKLVFSEMHLFGVQIERIPLSNYLSTQQNDFLVIFTFLTSKQKQNCKQYQSEHYIRLSDSGSQKIDDFLKFDISYSMMSEHFLEKFYGSTNQFTNKVPLRFEQKIAKKKAKLKYKEDQKKNLSKICGYKVVQNLEK